MKREPSTAGRSLGAVSIVITIITVLVFSTLAYSAYADTSGLLKVFGNAPSSPPVTISRSFNGSTVQVLVNITLHNEGFYPISLGGGCVNTPGGINATCSLPVTTLGPGQSETMVLKVVVSGLSAQNATAGRPMNAEFNLALEPFVTMDVKANLASLLSQGGTPSA